MNFYVKMKFTNVAGQVLIGEKCFLTKVARVIANVLKFKKFRQIFIKSSNQDFQIYLMLKFVMLRQSRTARK